MPTHGQCMGKSQHNLVGDAVGPVMEERSCETAGRRPHKLAGDVKVNTGLNSEGTGSGRAGGT